MAIISIFSNQYGVSPTFRIDYKPSFQAHFFKQKVMKQSHHNSEALWEPGTAIWAGVKLSMSCPCCSLIGSLGIV